jgi:hypothetical protein
MRIRLLLGTFLLWPLAILPRCGGQTVDPGTGSETNWVGWCTADADCEKGRCLCGLCATPCEHTGECGDDSVCAPQGSTLLAEACQKGTPPDEGGICLVRCDAERPCANAARCEDGVCVPFPVDAPHAGSLGDRCLPSEETREGFGSFLVAEVNLETPSADCASRQCLVHHFQGRSSCPYGQPDPRTPACFTPDGDPVTVPVAPQLIARPPASAVLCSCRCDGPDDGPFCACPRDFECRPLIEDLDLDHDRHLVGSYCVKTGTFVSDPKSLEGGATCRSEADNCSER